MRKAKHTAKTLLIITTSLMTFFSSSVTANMFVPMQPCVGCTIEISDHTGVTPTSKNAVFRVNNPVTPNGTPSWLELYNPTLANIQNCVAMVSSVQGPTPFTVQLKASEYKLSGSNQVVFLVDQCRKVNLRPGAGPGMGQKPGMDKKPGMGQRPGMGQKPGMGKRPGMEQKPGMVKGPKLGGGIRPGGGNQSNTCGSGTPPPSTSCSTSGGGWQTVSNVLSEDNCQLGYTDASAGPGQFVLYDNDYSVTCTGGSHKPAVFVSTTRSNSNWGAYVQPSETCQMKTGPSPTGSGRVVEKIVCP